MALDHSLGDTHLAPCAGRRVPPASRGVEGAHCRTRGDGRQTTRHGRFPALQALTPLCVSDGLQSPLRPVSVRPADADMSQSLTPVVLCERTTAVGWLVTRRCPPSIGATRAPVIATAPGSGGRDLKRRAVAASWATASNSDTSGLTMSRGRCSNLLAKAAAPCLHRSRGRCLLSWQTGRRAWPGGCAIPASTYEPDSSRTPISCAV